MSFTLQKLTEGIRDRHVGQQNKRLVEKWSRTGLLRGMEEVNRENMATLLENQAAQALRESNSMGSGDVGGFTNIAFPIVRRVFGGLVANELVSIQPMSLPSGLLFYLDYTYGSDQGGYKAGESIYGSPAGRKIQDGADAVGGQYDLAGSGFSRRHITVLDGQDPKVAAKLGQAAAGDVNNRFTIADAQLGSYNADAEAPLTGVNSLNTTSLADLKALQFDSQLIERIADASIADKYSLLHLTLNSLRIDNATTNPFSSEGLDKTAIKDVALHLAGDGGKLKVVAGAVQQGSLLNVRRLNQLGTFDVATGKFVADVDQDLTAANAAIRFVIRTNGAATLAAEDLSAVTVSFVKADGASMATAQGFGEVAGAPAFEADFTTDGTPTIPEIDIKIESIPVTAQTRKLRARWSPELAQDLNAYHSMDAEVELTQILSEQIALEIDREILGDLLTGAKGANFFWSRSPGKFVNKRTGKEIERTSTLNPGPAFTGTVREWYETLTETVIDVANEIHRKTLRGSANFIVVSPDVATVLEASVLYRPSYSLDGDGQVSSSFTMGAEKIGTLSNRFTVYKDPYFPRNKILVGYKGGSYLETGFVYAPYVPLIVTPTIFQPEDFTPRKGVMTRYGKKMVRADFFGTVTCLDMNII